MNIIISLIVTGIVLAAGLVFTFAPVWGIRIVCRCARSYMKEDLSVEPAQVLAFRFYGIAAAALGFYALFQILQTI
ncbi:MAG: hypothetical protein PVJ01_03370 [Pseudomonadota bacterium]|jgi:hypothetical protein